MRSTHSVLALIAALVLLIGIARTAAQSGTPAASAPAALGSAFTYQGRLTNGAGAANGAFALDFHLYDVAAGGQPLASQAIATVPITNGLFTVLLDFGAGAFDGSARWLEIEVNGTTLAPRQALTPAPYALFAPVAGSAPWDGLSGVPAGFADNTDDEGPGATRPVSLLSTPHSAGSTGAFSSVAIGVDGLPIIAYKAGADLAVAHCADVACTTVISTTLDSSGNVDGNFPSLAIGADGLPLISYSSIPTGGGSRLKAAHCDNLACTSAQISTVDSSSTGVAFTSLNIGIDGLGLIMYQGSNRLRAAHCADMACTSATITILDTSQTNGQHTAATIGSDGLALISYFKDDGDGSGNLKTAQCQNITCTSVISATLVFGTNSQRMGTDTAITVGLDGLGVISYRDDTLNDLYVAHCTDLACASATSTRLVDGTVQQGTADGAITIGSDGLGLIAYFDEVNDNLEVLHCINPLCTSATSFSLPSVGTDPNTALTANPALTIGTDGMPFITYHDMINLDLKALHCSNTLCLPYVRRH